MNNLDFLGQHIEIGCTVAFAKRFSTTVYLELYKIIDILEPNKSHAEPRTTFLALPIDKVTHEVQDDVKPSRLQNNHLMIVIDELWQHKPWKNKL